MIYNVKLTGGLERPGQSSFTQIDSREHPESNQNAIVKCAWIGDLSIKSHEFRNQPLARSINSHSKADNPKL